MLFTNIILNHVLLYKKKIVNVLPSLLLKQISRRESLIAVATNGFCCESMLLGATEQCPLCLAS